MMMVQKSTIQFPSKKESGTQSKSVSLTFPENVKNLAVFISGYQLKFQDQDGETHDHDLHEMMVRVVGDVNQSDKHLVNVTATIGLRDDSDFDDEYRGFVDVTVLAESDT